MRRTNRNVLFLILPTFAGASTLWAQTTVYDSGGFESPRFSTSFTNNGVVGNLHGQDAGVNAWKESTTDPAGTSDPSAGTAIVQASGGGTGLGAQDVLVTRTQYDNRWAPLVSLTPTTQNLVSISWEMSVNQAPGSSSNFGPFFGIEANDSTSGIKQLAAFGVDATTGDILVYDQSAGALNTVPGDPTVAFGKFNDFVLTLDYSSFTYAVILNGKTLDSGLPFFSGNSTHFTDADIAALQDAPSAQANQSGSAIFDNYRITNSEGALPVPNVMLSANETLYASNDASIGPAGDGVEFNGGALSTLGPFATARPILVDATGGTISILGGTTLTLNAPSLTWSNGTLTTAGTGVLAFNLNSAAVYLQTGATLSISTGSSVVVNGTTDPFTDSNTPTNHVAVVDNGSLSVNTVNCSLAGITGSGQLTVGTGSTSNELQLGAAGGASSIGSITISAGASLVQSGGSLTATTISNASLFQQTGGTANVGAITGTGSLSIGNASGASAGMTVSSLNQSSVTINSTGRLTIHAGSANALNSLTLNGNGSLDMANSHLVVNDDIDEGSGTLSLSNGAQVTQTLAGGYIVIGAAAGTGTVTLGSAGQTDPGAALTSASSIYVGGDQYGDLGTGTVNVYAGATLSTAGTLKIWNSSGTRVNLAGGTIQAATLDTSGNASLFNWTAGTLNLTSSSLTIGSGGPLGSSLALGSGQTLQMSGASQALYVTGGALSLSGGGQALSGGITTIGADSGTGNVTLGNAGQTDPGAALTSTGSIYVGGDESGNLGTGVVNVYAGTALSTGGTLKIWNSSGTRVNLAGGTIQAATLDTSGNANLFNWTAGTLNLTSSSLTIGSGGPLGSSLALGSGQTLQMSGASQALYVTGGALSLSGGGQALSGGDTIIGTPLAPGNVTLGNAGQTDPGAALTSTGSIYVGGDESGNLGTGVINVYAGTTLTTAGTLKIWNSSGTSVNLAGGTIKVATLDTSANASLFNWTAGTLAITGSNINTPSITVPSTGKLVFEPNSNAPITLNSLTISPGGIADLGNYQFFVSYGSGSDPVSTIAGYLKTGYANGAWNGPGIDSSAAAANPGYALGYADGGGRNRRGSFLRPDRDQIHAARRCESRRVGYRQRLHHRDRQLRQVVSARWESSGLG